MLGGFSAVVLGAAAATGWLVWDALDAAGRRSVAVALEERALAVGLVALGIVALLAWALAVPFRAYVVPARRLAEAGRVALLTNPGHRVPVEAGGPELGELAAVLNRLAERAEVASAAVDEQAGAAQVELTEERNRLATLMAQLPQGVLVCSTTGRIRLYNERAVELLEGEEGGGYVGLDRSLHALVDADAIGFALAEAQRRAEQGDAHPVTSFVVAADGARLLHAQLSPVRAEAGAAGSYVVTFEDVTRRLAAANRREALLRSLTERTRAAVGTIRAAVETIAGYPDMEPEQRTGFTDIIAMEAVGLGAELDRADAMAGAHLDAHWPLDEMLASDLLAVLARRLGEVWGSPCAAEAAEPFWLRVDSHALVQGLASVARRVGELGTVERAVVRAWAADGLARIELEWVGAAPDPSTFTAWESSRPAGDESTPLSLKEVAERHAGEVLYRGEPDEDRAVLRLLLPVGVPAGADDRSRRVQRVAGYDLRLLQRVDRATDLDAQPLDELTCTVLDTETTGLSPAEGDEIIALGAVRVVHGRLLRHERFSQLVDPQRPVPAASTRIHGLDDAMLQGRPPIAAVLPAFARFCGDTVLVGHNLAFDLRFLQDKEAQAGVRFRQPVLDTLLLSAVVAPHQQDHSLEAIAERLGIEVVARHTALGDALLTAQVLLALLPLLRDRGITTLGQARAASAASYLSTLRY